MGRLLADAALGPRKRVSVGMVESLWREAPEHARRLPVRALHCPVRLGF
jgi:hypothetical protein